MASRFRTLPYDEGLAQRVLDRIAEGAMLRDLWRDPSLPTRGDLRRWRHADPAFDARVREAVNRARGRRMTSYDEAVAETICVRLIEGESPRGICLDPAMPSLMTAYEWRRTQPAFDHALAVARELQADRLGEQGWEIARSITPQTARAAATQLTQLRWWAGKLSPKKYGRHKPVDPTASGRRVQHVYVKRFTDAGESGNEATPPKPPPP
ncbi:hypothetical protein [Phenylobacterium sp.]|jgi:hypothetical protein|uniref:terminase small subunit-like protein n=1 Tax=Phenylobacterium sp. TaxID=1871053 RepID=UPI002E36DC3A|nr:hypothetical protein [Phenylobacterium sp.]HEX3364729.1 hypothetical protein [Phenylobacterium sp.]